VKEPVLTREAVRALDRRAIEEYGIPSIVLMENAGRACAEEVVRRLGSAPGPVLVLCGPGNNGGDGLVIARTLLNRNLEAGVAFVGTHASLEKGSPDFRTNLHLWRGLGRSVSVVEDAAAAEDLKSAIVRSALVVDALFGTGLTRELDDPWRTVIRLLNASGRPVLSVDLPSGLDADTGEPLGTAVRAESTVTFVALKPGLLRASAPELGGEVVVAEIGIPRSWIRASS